MAGGRSPGSRPEHAIAAAFAGPGGCASPWPSCRAASHGCGVAGRGLRSGGRSRGARMCIGAHPPSRGPACADRRRGRPTRAGSGATCAEISPNERRTSRWPVHAHRGAHHPGIVQQERAERAVLERAAHHHPVPRRREPRHLDLRLVLIGPEPMRVVEHLRPPEHVARGGLPHLDRVVEVLHADRTEHRMLVARDVARPRTRPRSRSPASGPRGCRRPGPGRCLPSARTDGSVPTPTTATSASMRATAAA